VSDATRCDNCGKVSESSTPLGWWRLERRGDVVPVAGLVEYDFCSTTCLAVMASSGALR